MEAPVARPGRPTLKDPQEFALIRDIYFAPIKTKNEDLDPLERLDRMDRRKTVDQSR